MFNFFPDDDDDGDGIPDSEEITGSVEISVWFQIVNCE